MFNLAYILQFVIHRPNTGTLWRGIDYEPSIHFFWIGKAFSFTLPEMYSMKEKSDESV